MRSEVLEMTIIIIVTTSSITNYSTAAITRLQDGCQEDMTLLQQPLVITSKLLTNHT
jgi:hypothetical protein